MGLIYKQKRNILFVANRRKKRSMKEVRAAAHFILLSMQSWIALLKTATKKSASSIVMHMGGLIRKVWNGEKSRRRAEERADEEMQVENTHHRSLDQQVKEGLSYRTGTNGSHVQMEPGKLADGFTSS